LIAREPEETRLLLEPITVIYRCEIDFAQKNWGMLAQGIERLRLCFAGEDQRMALSF
jgi:hypothetical protein